MDNIFDGKCVCRMTYTYNLSLNPQSAPAFCKRISSYIKMVMMYNMQLNVQFCFSYDMILRSCGSSNYFVPHLSAICESPEERQPITRIYDDRNRRCFVCVGSTVGPVVKFAVGKQLHSRAPAPLRIWIVMSTAMGMAHGACSLKWFLVRSITYKR